MKKDAKAKLLRVIKKADRDLAEGKARSFEEIVKEIEFKHKSRQQK